MGIIISSGLTVVHWLYQQSVGREAVSFGGVGIQIVGEIQEPIPE